MNSDTFFKVMLTGLFIAAPACGGGTSTTGDGSADVQDIQEVLDVQPELPAPHPITFIIRNTSSESTYLDFTFGAREAIGGGRSTDAAWEEIAYFPVSCMSDCDEADPGSDCCVMCDVEASTKVLAGREEVTVVWSGVSVYTFVDDYCDCTCYRRADPIPAAYQAVVCTYDSFFCPGESCTPDDQGLMFAPVTGDPACFEKIFQIPHEGTEVVIEVM